MDTNNTTKTYIVKKLERTAAPPALDVGGAWDTVGKIVFGSGAVVHVFGQEYVEARRSRISAAWSYHPDDLVEVVMVNDGAAKKGDYVKAGYWDSFCEVVAVAGDDVLTTSPVHGGGEWVPNRDLTIFRPVATDGSAEKIVALDGTEVHFAPPWSEVHFAPVDGTEVRVTSETGGQKGAKLARYDLMPVDALRELAEHYGRGEKKYPTEAGIPNFRKGYDISLSYAALQRHANQFWGGEDIDAETGSSHMIAAAWHALYIVQTMHDYGDRFDDRLTTSSRKLEED